ncbi:MAG: heavy metal translocating P-type ATPase, partial [Thermoplasmata archaeon]
MPIDPVCGMYVDGRETDLKLVRENRTTYFCSTACLEAFAEPSRQLARLLHRLAVAWPLAVVILVLTYRPIGPATPWILLGFASVVQAYAGAGFYRGLVDAARHRIWNMDVLIAVGTSLAYGYSALALALPGRIPPASFFDASSLILALILTGNYLEHRTREFARGALRRLGEMLPARARVLREGRELEIPLDGLAVGDVVLVRAGERVPADGSVIEGRSSIAEALLTGEPMPREKGPGDRVYAGTINGEGPLTVRVTGAGQDTVLAQIGRLLTEAEANRVPLQRTADRIASLFVPSVLALAVAATAFWAALGVGGPVLLLVFVSIVITACPCAFSIATPAAIVAGTGRAAESGILFQGADALERAAKVRVVLTDKTGTLTVGAPEVEAVRPAPGIREADLLGWAAAVEGSSEHPLGRAVRRRAAERGVRAPPATEVRAIPGRGIEGIVEGHRIAVLGAEGSDEGASAPPGPAAGRTVSVVRRDGVPVGFLTFRDPTRPGVREAVADLARDGIRTVLVTGDSAEAAAPVAEAAGIAEVHARVSPEGKRALVASYRARGQPVAFVGDGINDAPALAEADVGIAVGAGTDVAKAAGRLVLLRSDFADVALALRIGRRTVGKVRGNLLWALGYNAVLLPIAAGALVP